MLQLGPLSVEVARTGGGLVGELARLEDELQFVIELTASDFLEIALYNRTVRLNGTALRRGSLLEPNWFMLEVGDNFLQYRADTSGNPAASISYRNAWR